MPEIKSGPQDPWPCTLPLYYIPLDFQHNKILSQKKTDHFVVGFLYFSNKLRKNKFLKNILLEQAFLFSKIFHWLPSSEARLPSRQGKF